MGRRIGTWQVPGYSASTCLDRGEGEIGEETVMLVLWATGSLDGLEGLTRGTGCRNRQVGPGFGGLGVGGPCVCQFVSVWWISSTRRLSLLLGGWGGGGGLINLNDR